MFIGWFYGISTLVGLLKAKVSLAIIIPNYIQDKNIFTAILNW